MTAHVWAQKTGVSRKIHTTDIDILDGGGGRPDIVFENLLSDWTRPAHPHKVNFPDQIDPDLRIRVPGTARSATSGGRFQFEIHNYDVGNQETSTFLADCIPDRRFIQSSDIAQPLLVDIPVKQSMSAPRRPLRSLRPFILCSIAFHIAFVAVAGLQFHRPERVLQEGGTVISVVMLGNADTDANAGTESPKLIDDHTLAETLDLTEPPQKEISTPPAKSQAPEPLPLAPVVTEPTHLPDTVEPIAETVKEVIKPHDPEPVAEKAVSEVARPAVPSHQLATAVHPVLTAPRDDIAKSLPPVAPPLFPDEKTVPSQPPVVAKAPPAFRRDPAVDPPRMVPDIPQSTATKPPEQVIEPVSKEKPRSKPVQKSVKSNIKPDIKSDMAKTKAPMAKSGSAKIDSRKGTADGAETASSAGEKSTAKGTQSEGNSNTSNYPGKVRAKLKKAWKATRDGSKGSIVIGFTVSASGAVSEISVSGGKVSETVRKAAEAAVRRAAPFAPIPVDAGRSVWRFEIPVVLN